MTFLGDDEGFGGVYDCGHWEWDDDTGALNFKSDVESVEDSEAQISPVMLGAICFKDDLDLLEQQRFRKFYQRKSSIDDVVQLQDVKDLVLFTAPKIMLTAALINMLHLSSTERFIRALILYCQYFLQVTTEMAKRKLELEYKVRTDRSAEIESDFSENLKDLRILIAKEYAVYIQGGADYARYHHLGPSKKMKSLSKKELALFESFIRICVQIVWLALGRNGYNQLECEINRLFKSDIYNIVEHKNYSSRLESVPTKLPVIYGSCVNLNGKLKTQSPLMNEIRCERFMSYELFGLGLVQYPRLCHRLWFLEKAMSTPEKNFRRYGLTMGILGMDRARFDTMLKELPIASKASSSSITKSIGKVSAKSTTKKKAVSVKLYEDLYVPERCDEIEPLPEEFPSEMHKVPAKCNDIQRRKWLQYIKTRSKISLRCKINK